MSEQSEHSEEPDNRGRATTDEFRAFVRDGWAPRRPGVTRPSPASGPAAARRAVLSAAYPGQRLIVPAGGLKVRSNDTDYVFRPHTAFAWLTGLGADREPDAVLVLEPVAGGDGAGGGHEAMLYFRPLGDRDSDEFFADARYGEFWVGARPTIEDVELELGLTARHIDEFEAAAAKDAGEVSVRLVRDADRDLTARLDVARVENGAAAEGLEESDDALAHDLSHLRMCKDDHEVEQMRAAVAATVHGFEAMIAELPAPSRRAVASAGSREPSPSTRGTGETGSATTRSARPVTTPTPCTGSRTRVRSERGTSSSSTPASRSTPCTPPTSPARCRSPGPSPTPSARCTRRSSRHRRRGWQR